VLLTDTVTLADVDPLPDKAGVDDTLRVSLAVVHCERVEERLTVWLTVAQLL
jgi:hypothetical protein